MFSLLLSSLLFFCFPTSLHAPSQRPVAAVQLPSHPVSLQWGSEEAKAQRRCFTSCQLKRRHSNNNVGGFRFRHDIIPCYLTYSIVLLLLLRINCPMLGQQLTHLSSVIFPLKFMSCTLWDRPVAALWMLRFDNEQQKCPWCKHRATIKPQDVVPLRWVANLSSPSLFTLRPLVKPAVLSTDRPLNPYNEQCIVHFPLLKWNTAAAGE